MTTLHWIGRLIVASIIDRILFRDGMYKTLFYRFFHSTLTGDRVAVDPHITCRVCEFCKAGRYNMCPKVYFLATPPDDGALARYFVHAADFTFK